MKTNLWVSFNNKHSELIEPRSIYDSRVFPVFETKYPETKAARQARWLATHNELMLSQQQFIANSICREFFTAFHKAKFIDLLLEQDIRQKASAFFDSLAFHLKRIDFRFVTTETSVELDLVYITSASTTEHRLHVCNLSPSEYDKTR